MPYDVAIDRKNRILRARFHGHVTEDDLAHFVRNGHKHVPTPGPVAAIVDMSGASSFDVSAATIGLFAKVPPIIPDPNMVRLIIAPSGEVYGMSRMFELQAEHIHPNLHVVQSEREAWAILAVQTPQFEPLEFE
ncbi:MAG TPA: hypothetical protein VEJ38_16020 [Candidatus Acidoferrales bacterium]|nr:hypothetical protein [Candidatus Acidoferrales bacterium]